MGVAVKQEWVDQARNSRPDSRQPQRDAAKVRAPMPGAYGPQPEVSPGLPRRRG